jgi:hypothetical protein
MDEGSLEMANRSPRVADGLSARALVGYIKEVGGELVAGTRRFQTVLIVCEVEAPLVDDGEIEVVGEEDTSPARAGCWISELPSPSCLTWWIVKPMSVHGHCGLVQIAGMTA